MVAAGSPTEYARDVANGTGPRLNDRVQMNRRELIAWALAVPFVRSARMGRIRAPQIRVFADLKHTGRLAGPVNTRAITDADFGIAVPLPTFADGDLLPIEDPAKQDIASRLGLMRIETSESRAQIVVSVAGEGAGALRLYRKASDGWRRVSGTAPMTWTLETNERGRLEAGIGVVLPAATEGAEPPVWPRAFTVEIGAPGVQPQRVPFRVAPFIIPCALETAEEVLIVSRANTADAVRDLKQWSDSTKIAVYTLEAQDPCDQWMQDTMEPGVFAFPSAAGLVQAPGIMSGQRREFGAGAAGLDRQIADRLAERGQVIVRQSVPRKSTRWIDWFGNLEVSPPHTDSAGRRFPYGRVIIGQQRELTMHPDALRFLEAQRVQWPPIVLDTSWLSIGHVDEIINFVPARTSIGYKVLLPSPLMARTVLDGLIARSLGDLPVFAGTRDETTVAKLRDAAASEENVGIDATITKIRDQLQRELSIRDTDFAMLPCVFNRGRAVIPNAVNCLAVNGHLVATQPKGPRDGGKDLFEEAIRAGLAGCAVDITFVDAWRAYHMAAGEVHCGTNTFRRLKNGAWWAHVDRR